MTVSIERFEMNGSWVPPWISHQHISRYEWASRLVNGCKVIDAACGSGYGAKMLADGGAIRVEAFDLSVEAVAESRDVYGETENLHFHVAEVTHLPIPDHTYDVYVSFETIEHVQDDHALLAEAVRVLKPGGKFVCSTPNRNLLNPGTSIHSRPFNPYHIREYSTQEFQSSLQTHFHQVQCFGQSFYAPWYCKMLRNLGKISPSIGVRLHQLRKLCGIPWEDRKKDYPCEMEDSLAPEMLIALSTVKLHERTIQ